jgi:hypothetical protein
MKTLTPDQRHANHGYAGWPLAAMNLLYCCPMRNAKLILPNAKTLLTSSGKPHTIGDMELTADAHPILQQTDD